MATKSQIIANCLNAQKSTGPRTPEGKAAVSQNALKHGLTAQQTVIGSESQADFDLHREQILSELAPVTAMESILAERIVSLSWRLNRAELIQNQSINALNTEYIKYFSTKSSYSQEDSAASSPDLTLGQMAIRDFSNSRVLDRLLMYERRIEQSLYKTMLEFQKLRLRNSNPQHPQSASHESRLPLRSPAGLPLRGTKWGATLALRSPQGEVGSDDSPITNNHSPVTNNHSPITNNHSPVTNHPSPVLEQSTEPALSGPVPSIVEGVEGNNELILQNKPNLPNTETNVTSTTTKDYENKSPTQSPENKPNQTRSDLSAVVSP